MADDIPNWDTYFMNIAQVVKARSSCVAPKKGAIIVQGTHLLSGGYNGTPKGTKNCNAGGCERCANRTPETSGQDLGKCACNHCEENAILLAANHGTSTEGATLYTTHTPCTLCAKMIINSGIKRVVAGEKYPDDLGTKLLEEAGVKLELFGDLK